MLNEAYGSAYTRRMKINANIANSKSIGYMKQSVKSMNTKPEVKMVKVEKIKVKIK